jgi:hypothetical protein
LQAGSAVGELDEGFCGFRFGSVEDYAGLGFGVREEGGLEGGLVLLLLLLVVLIWHTAASNGSSEPTLPTRPRSHHSPNPEDKGSVIHSDSIEVSKSGLLKLLGVVEDLAGVPDCFARLRVLGPGADLRVDSAGFVFACATGEELDIV